MNNLNEQNFSMKKSVIAGGSALRGRGGGLLANERKEKHEETRIR